MDIIVQWLNNWFSNFLPFEEPLIEDGIKYQTVENYYVAYKTTDIEKRKYIASLTPNAARRYGKKLLIRADWDMIREDTMLKALRWKFKKGTDYYDILMATSDWDIVEYNNWNDTYWGVNVNPRWKLGGLNRLGILIMKLRDELRQ